ncbi:MAG: hypothetical protein JXD23_03965 [Spirochaetales bacterium]|nr:hypothetical protein [Spirochaetales bacterium]
MKRIITAAFLAAFFFTPPAAFATDVGVIVENTTSVLTVENKLFYQKDKITLWTLFDLSETAAINIEGYYRFAITDPMNVYSLDRLELSADFPVLDANPFLFGFALGRLQAADFTGYVVSHPLDGGRLVFRNSFLNAEVCGGFTGLLFKGDSLLDMSIADNNYSPSALPLVPPRLIGVLTLNFPELFLAQTVNLSVVGQLDMQSEENLIQPGPAAIPDYNNGGKIDTLYAGLGIEGRLFPQFFYHFFFYFEYGRTLSYDYASTEYGYVPIYAFFSGLKIDWYLSDAPKSRLTFDVLVASGDRDYENYLEGNTDAYSNQFIPVTRPTIGLVNTLQLTNLIVGRLEFSIQPFSDQQTNVWRNLEISVAALTYFRAALSDVSDSTGLNSGSVDYYLGSEADLITAFKPLNDLGLEIAFGIFLPNNYTADSAYSASGRNVEFLARLKLVLEF